MKTKIINHLLLSLLFVTISVFLGADIINAQSADVVAIGPASMGNLSKVQIKQILKGDIYNWPSGGEVKVIFNKNSDIMKAFCKKYLNMSPTRLANIWVKKGISDGVPSPRKMPSNVIVTMVSNSDKFIGFVLRSETGEGVKVLE